MVFVESNQFGSREEREQTLGKRMGRVGEEGQISDRELIQEISKDEYKSLNRTVPLQAATVTGASSASMAADSRERYWMRDLYKYSYPRSYAASGLHNLAWAQAVQNKPLNEVLVEFKGDDNLTRSLGPEEKNESNSLVGSQDNGSTDASGDQAVNEGPAADSEMEEGELEEGEIDFDSEPGKAVEQEIISSRLNVNRFDTEMDDGELETQVESIRKMLYNVNEIEAQKSFDIACARLKSTLEDLRELVLRTWFPSKDSLIQQSFAAVQCVYSVFCSMSAIQKEQSRNKMTSLLEFLMSFSTGLFTREQKKEIEAMVASNSSLAGPLQTKCSKSQEELAVTDKAILTDSNSLAVDTSHNFDSLKNDKSDVSGGVSGKKDINMLPDVLKPLQSIPKGRSGFGPLLDLHKVHDEDSLPSPTSKTPPSLLGNLPGSVGMFKPESAPVHPYETDAVKAVSTYQQKFGRSTFMSHDRLPSPTPSEECSGGGADDSSEEVSSYFTAINNVKTVTQPVLPQRSSTPSSSISPVQGSVSGSSTAAPSGALHNPSLRGSAKSRDPRLRYRNLGSSDLSYSPLPLVSTPAPKLEPLGEIMKPEKQKTPEVPILDGPALKKPRNGLEAMDVVVNAKDIQTTAGSSGSGTRGVTGPQLINRSQLGSTATDPRKSESWGVSLGMTNPSVSVSASRQCAVSIGNTASLQSLLKDIAVNPAAWINILKEQKRSGEPAENTTHPVTSSSILGAVPLPNVVPPSSSGVGQRATGLVQVPSQIAAVNLQDESTKIRMKPRDPRRVLHTNTIQKSGSSGVEPPKTNGFPVATFQGVQDHKKVSGTDTSAAPSQAPFSPDIAKQLANNLKNIAEIISAPQTLPVPPPMLAQGSSQAMLVNLDRVNVRSGEVPNSSDRLNRSGLRPGEVDTGHPQSHSTWGDVEHLFEGYDDQQIAAIQQERSRRIEEQKKMFAARKLCLVLDLDHTLLNSAKFSEVDPIHDEILRKKEEQDREKPQRHLFRFPHMQMWTKLRPGIWNFLEKASKLYELHLYTMGNKLYATEMARVLDPKGNLFAGRVISRGGDGDVFDGDDRVPRSKDLEGVLGMESAVVIIDDSVRVWPHNKLNLIVVERYTYFPCSRRQFGLPGPSLLEIDHDERPEDGTLASSLSVIERIHQNFFSHKSLDEVDVRNILASEQQKILAGCRIVFSRVFPVGEASPHLHPLWQTAEQFGAVCTNQIDEQVTHVVANSHGTDKVNWALSTGRYVVHPGWVEASALLYRRANEQNFAIKP